jgi:hypothetical protein
MVIHVTTGAAAADAQPSGVETIARVLSEFVHVCTPGQREILHTLIDSRTTTGEERVLARALLRVEHVPDPADVPRLLAIASDLSLPEGVRTVATVLQRLVHMPTEQDQEILNLTVKPQRWMCPLRLSIGFEQSVWSTEHSRPARRDPRLHPHAA